jgi:beta-glucosidase
MKIYSLLKLSFLVVIIFFSKQSIQAQSKLNEAEIEKKINEIISKLSLEEKVGQTCQITLDAILKTGADGRTLEPNEIDKEKLQEAVLKYHVGSILNVSFHTLTLKEWRKILTDVHSYYQKKQSKTPIIYGVDAIHGVNYTVGATLFPQELGLAATWNPFLAKRFGEITGYELRASGIPWNFSPVLDLGRQPLWSRFFETLGEDPYLVSQMGKAIISGYQGNNISNKYQVLSCMKHFVGYSMPLTGRDRTPAWIPEKYITELFLPPFEEAVKTGSLSVMINSGEVNGIPGHINHHLITEILKRKWGFKGFAVTDWEDILMLETVHRVAKNQKEAIAMAFNAGIDMSMVPNSPMYKDYCTTMIKAVNDGSLPMARLDDAVKRILYTKFKLDLFENQTYPQKDYPDFASDKFKESALNAALESITLLKNEDNILPLNKDAKILVCGPTSNDLNSINGAWTHTWQGVDTNFNTKGVPTIYQAIKKMNPKAEFSKGVELYFENGWEQSKFVNLDDLKAKMQRNDVLVICVGELPGTEKPADIISLNLSKEQLDLVKLAKTFNKKIVLVLTEGRPRIIHDVVADCDAIIQTYLPGDFGGEALSKIIFGEINPSGKLPYSYPKYDGLIEHYDRKRSEDRSGKSEKFDAYNPEWDFGFGLTYTNFEFSNFKVSNTFLTSNDSIIISIDVKNIGNMEGKEVVQLYISNQTSSISPFGKQLKNFEKINLKPNELKTVNFVVSAKDVKFVDGSNKWVNENRSFDIIINNFKSSIAFMN